MANKQSCIDLYMCVCFLAHAYISQTMCYRKFVGKIVNRMDKLKHFKLYAMCLNLKKYKSRKDDLLFFFVANEIILQNIFSRSIWAENGRGLIKELNTKEVN